MKKLIPILLAVFALVSCEKDLLFHVYIFPFSHSL